jgi:hypothetical protein
LVFAQRGWLSILNIPRFRNLTILQISTPVVIESLRDGSFVPNTHARSGQTSGAGSAVQSDHETRGVLR